MPSFTTAAKDEILSNKAVRQHFPNQQSFGLMVFSREFSVPQMQMLTRERRAAQYYSQLVQSVRPMTGTVTLREEKLSTGQLAYRVTVDDMADRIDLYNHFAMLYPDMQVLLFFLIPLKVKWLAWLDAAFFAVGIVQSLVMRDIIGLLMPLIAILNFLVYFWPEITETIAHRHGYAQARSAPQAIHFKKAAKDQERKAKERGYHHKCCVCGRTDTDYPNLEFRYCSKCAGYHCFCQDHIFNHVHFTEP